MPRRFHSLWACSLAALAGAAEGAETVTYSYDSLGRLVRVDRAGTVNHGVSAQYSYDPADNRTNVKVEGVPTVAGGSFELPEIHSGYVYRPGGSPAVFAGGSGVTGNGSVWNFPLAPQGDQVAFLQGGDSLGVVSLPVSGLQPNSSYKLKFRIARRPNYLDLTLSVSFEGVPLGTFTTSGDGFVIVTSAAFTAASTSGIVIFTASGTINNNGALDWVTIVPAEGN
jgi:hypothetical protein